MTLTPEQIQKLTELAKPVVAFINNEMHPHCKVVIDSNSFEVSEGVAFVPNLYTE